MNLIGQFLLVGSPGQKPTLVVICSCIAATMLRNSLKKSRSDIMSVQYAGGSSVHWRES